MNDIPRPGRDPLAHRIWADLTERVRGDWRTSVRNFQAWRALARIGRDISRHPMSSWNWDRITATLSYATFAMGLPFSGYLTVRAHARRRPDFVLGGPAGGQTVEDSNAANIAFAWRVMNAGRIPDAVRLAEHLGVAYSRHRATDFAETTGGLLSAAAGPDAVKLTIGPWCWPLNAEALNVAVTFTANRLRRWPERLAGEAFAVAVLLACLGLEVVSFLAKPGSREAAGLGLSRLSTGHFSVLTRPPRRLRDPGPTHAIRLSVAFLDEITVVYVLRAPGVSWAARDVPGRPVKHQGWLRRGDYAALLFEFHYSSRRASPEELAGPNAFLIVAGALLRAPLARLKATLDRSLLVLRTSGLTSYLPYAALRPDGVRALVERFDVVHDDGLDPPRPSEQRHGVAALWGGPDLRGAREEVALIHAAASKAGVAWRGSDGPDGRALTRERLGRALQEAQVVHLATHFRGHPHDPDRAELQLADGSWLEVAAAVADGAGAELIFLSGCETGIGADFVDGGGGDGAGPWRRAGARSVVSTLWRVPDHAAGAVAKAFYGALFRGEGRAAALAHAQLQLLRAAELGPAGVERFFDAPEGPEVLHPEESKRLSHPRAWGSYRLTGAWEPIAAFTSSAHEPSYSSTLETGREDASRPA